jgi:hypothetical protein
MSNQQLVEREAVVRTGTATQTREAGQQGATGTDRSEDHLIRGYN